MVPAVLNELMRLGRWPHLPPNSVPTMLTGTPILCHDHPEASYQISFLEHLDAAGIGRAGGGCKAGQSTVLALFDSFCANNRGLPYQC